MNREDAPYVTLTLVFGLAIFVAGRMSAPTPEPQVVVVHDRSPQAAPSVVVITSAAAPESPMALLPERPASSATAPVRPVSKAPVASKAATPESIRLEETPELPPNPYKSSNAPGF